MTDFWHVEDMAAALRLRELPTVTIWNRVEGRPRSVAFDGALRAEVRDALWMLTRQWQLGEFRGSDAGSPIVATYELSCAEPTLFRPREGTPVALDESVPLEATVESRPLWWRTAAGVGALDLRLLLGRRWLRSVSPAYRASYIARYPFDPPDPQDAGDTDLVADVETWATLQALAGRAMDGYALYAHLTAAPAHRPWDGMTVADADRDPLTAAGTAFVAWVDGLVHRSGVEAAWDPARLEHRFSVTAPLAAGEKRLVAEEYPGGRLDWYSFSVAPDGPPGPGTTRKASEVIPAEARFDGMPHRRWWAFEDGRTNFGDISADTTDLARLLLIEFGLVFGNDWFVIPCELDVGTVARVEGLSVTNVFGERYWVEAAGRGRDDDWQRWSMFTLDVARPGDDPADTSLLLLPTVPKVNESAPLEDVQFVRDEVSNMVWGVERMVRTPTGEGRRGAEVAADALAHRTRLVQEATSGGTAPTPPAAPIAYRVMTSVPEHWIPFVATHVPGDVRETQLQRAAMPRLIEEDPASVDRVRPRTSLLREGLDRQPRVAYFVHEEEVPRAGTEVTLAFQRTRWVDGRVFLWVATHRKTGQGEASPGLGFDRIVPT